MFTVDKNRKICIVHIMGVPDEWATTKCSIVHKFCSDHWNEINIVHIATISNSQITKFLQWHCWRIGHFMKCSGE